MAVQNKRLVLSVLNMFFFIGTITVNALANILPINGMNTGELSDMYPNLFVPAGVTFSIWGVIYLLLLFFCINLLISSFSDSEGTAVERTGIFFILSSIFNIAWIFAWHYELVLLSLLMMLGLLFSLIMLYLRLENGEHSISGAYKWLAQLPISVYLGWITVATIANVTAVLVDFQWGMFGLSEVFWTIAVLITALIISLLMLLRRNDVFYSMVVVWAFAGIIIKRIGVGDGESMMIVTAIVPMIVVIIAGIILRFRKWLEL